MGCLRIPAVGGNQVGRSSDLGPVYENRFCLFEFILMFLFLGVLYELSGRLVKSRFKRSQKIQKGPRTGVRASQWIRLKYQHPLARTPHLTVLWYSSPQNPNETDAVHCDSVRLFIDGFY